MLASPPACVSTNQLIYQFRIMVPHNFLINISQECTSQLVLILVDGIMPELGLHKAGYNEK